MAARKSKHRYEELKPANEDGGEFRLLTLLPGAADSIIECSLQSCTFAGPPSYEALSYAWGNPKGPSSKFPVAGDPSSRYEINLNGGTAEVSYNLHAALLQIRAEKDRVLWVDAICIDQDNKAEKSHQVQSMARIYKGADRVLSWLGEHDDSVDLAFDIMIEVCYATKALFTEYIATKRGITFSQVTDDMIKSVIVTGDSNDDWYGLGMYSHDCAKAFSSVCLDLGSVLEDPVDLINRNCPLLGPNFPASSPTSVYVERTGWLDALRDVFGERSYWRRLWVSQEISLAKDVTLCSGRRQMDKSVTTIPRFLERVEEINDPVLAKLFDTFDFRFATELYNAAALLGPGRHSRFWTLTPFSDQIAITNSLLCTDPRDHIYALLDMKSDPIDIKADYRKKTSEVYIEATRAAIVENNNLDILCARTNLIESQDSGRLPYIDLPSWVPHYESIIRSTSFWQIQGCQLYCAGGPSNQRAYEGSPGGDSILAISGYCYGSISTVGHIIHTVADLNEDLLSYLRSPSIRRHTKTLTEKQTWQALCLDHGFNFDMTYSHQRLSKSDARSDFIDKYFTGAAPSPPPRDLTSSLSFRLNGMTICNTYKDEVAIVYGGVQENDIVYVADGAPVPFILRPAQCPKTKYKATEEQHLASEDFYEIVGPAYVHGIMDGEVPAMAKLQHDEVRDPGGKRRRLDKPEVRKSTVFLV